MSIEDQIGFEEYLRNMEPHLKELLVKYRIPVEDAGDLLEQTLLALLYYWQRVQDPEYWLLNRLELNCTSYWHARGKSAVTE